MRTLLPVLLILLYTPQLSAWEGLRRGGTCLKTKKKCISTLGNAGGYGLACCDPFSINAEKCVHENPCRGGKLYRWPTEKLPLRWFVNFNRMVGREGFVYFTKSELLDLFKKAWDAWSSQKCTDFKHRYSGETAAQLDPEDRKLIIYLPSKREWVLLGQDFSTLAISRPMADDKGRIYDADIAISPRSSLSPWQKGPDASIDLLGVVAHEIGHSLGFGHSPYRTLMYFANLSGEFRGLSHDEISGICELYPKLNCSESRTCGQCFQCVDKKCKIKAIKKIDKFCKPCNISSDCGPGNYCVYTVHGKRCLQSCSSPGDCCPRGYHCRALNWNIHLCWPNTNSCPAIPCRDNSQCGEGERCQGGYCQPAPVEPTPTLCKIPPPGKGCGRGESLLTFPDGTQRCAMPCKAGIFCPKGFSCRATSKGRVCIPKDWICPCRSDGDCAPEERCLQGKCRPKKCGFKCLCGEEAPCPSGYVCAKFGQHRICLQRCGEPIFSAGSLGSACHNATCREGGQCLSFRNGLQLCLRPCGKNSPCPEGMGICSTFGGHGICLCYGDGDCNPKKGLFCNKTYLNSWGVGVCSRALYPPRGCQKGFFCKRFGERGGVCLPQAKGFGDSCGGLVSCKEGGVCVAISSSQNRAGPTGVCLELCKPSQRCWGGGRCGLSLSDGSKACSCRNDGDCLLGQSCRKLQGSISICWGKVAPPCGDGICQRERGENCRNCPGDCTCERGQFCSAEGNCRPLPSCGDGICGTAEGENCFNCPGDCKCPVGYRCQMERCSYTAEGAESTDGYQIKSSCNCNGAQELSLFPLLGLLLGWLLGLRRTARRRKRIFR